MPRPSVRAPRFATALASLAAAVTLLAAPPAHAEPRGPLFEFDTLAEPGYELRLSLAYFSAERSDFSQLVFLVPQPLRTISVQELRSDLDLRISLTKRLALQAVLPLSLRSADVELQNVVVSTTQVLRGQRLTLDAAGVPDPTLAVAYRVFQDCRFAVQVELGTRVPLDDNPGSPVLPKALPLGTGQNQVFVGAGGSLATGRVKLALGYRFEYHPGSTATYLVRQIGNTGTTSGALDAFMAHRVSAAATVALDEHWSVELAPDFRVDEQPSVIERGGPTRLLLERFRYELLFAASIQVRFDAHNALRLGYSQPLLLAFDEDPFFPITVPEEGVRLTWLFSAR